MHRRQMDLFIQPAISALVARCCSIGVSKMPIAGWILLTWKNWPQVAGEESKILLHHAELLKKKISTFKGHLWTNSQVNWSKEKIIFADTMSCQSLPATGSLQHLLLWELGLVHHHLPVGNKCRAFPKIGMLTSTFWTRLSIWRGVSELPERAVVEKPICNSGRRRNAVPVTMPNTGIKSTPGAKHS